MNLFNGPAGPTQAPGLRYERVPGTQVIRVINQVTYALQIAYLEVKGGFPMDAVGVVTAKIGSWITITTVTNRMREFHEPTLNETHIRAFGVMGIEIAQDLGILEEYEREYAKLDGGDT